MLSKCVSHHCCSWAYSNELHVSLINESGSIYDGSSSCWITSGLHIYCSKAHRLFKGDSHLYNMFHGLIFFFVTGVTACIGSKNILASSVSIRIERGLLQNDWISREGWENWKHWSLFETNGMLHEIICCTSSGLIRLIVQWMNWGPKLYPFWIWFFCFLFNLLSLTLLKP